MEKWREYEHLTDLYKTYLSIMVNLGVFSFAAIGGISSYVLANQNLGIEKYAILFPLCFSLGLTYIYGISIKPAKELESSFNNIGNIQIQVELVPHAYLLTHGVFLFLALYVLIDIGLIVLSYDLLCRLN